MLLFEAKYKTKDGEGFKILTPNQMLQRLPIALTQVEASNNSPMKSDKLFILCIYIKKYTITKLNQYNDKNGYYIY